MNLADYFSPKAEQKYKDAIMTNPSVIAVPKLKSHYKGNLVTLNVAVVIDGDKKVSESFKIAEAIEAMMKTKFVIIDTDVSFIPDSVIDTKNE
ncbi:cation transporter dimerization domain-containing protein [Fructilactobacillus myrtifloralis]|uniref:cation transporter dimerization domain-containing protein n=1 Tax=Fructilactobacillus myrtifloralis TaxID=2940301 RepID=UPI00237CDE61|nr:cation transporter dimerization domain-containing protein [Fructilactobacillus myrtifloralis]